LQGFIDIPYRLAIFFGILFKLFVLDVRIEDLYKFLNIGRVLKIGMASKESIIVMIYGGYKGS
jgi:hypothetical protein